MNPPYIIEHVDNPTPEAIKIVEDSLFNFNHQHGCKPATPIAVFLTNQQADIVGGVYGELGLDWLYIDLLWVDDTYKKRGQGRQLMHTIEQHALKHGISNIHLATTSFQALPFYYHIGYRLFGIIEDRPQGYNYYYLHKQVHKGAESPLEVVENPKSADIFKVVQGLRQHGQNKGIDNTAYKVHIFLKAQDGTILGGLLGAIYWDWLDLQTFWIHESVCGQGYGTQMLKLAEDITTKHNAPRIALDVIDFQHLPFFEHHGFRTFGKLPNRPTGHNTHFMLKHL